MHLFGYQNKLTCFQKLKSSNVFYACAWQNASREVGASYKAASIIHIIILFIYIYIYIYICVHLMISVKMMKVEIKMIIYYL